VHPLWNSVWRFLSCTFHWKNQNFVFLLSLDPGYVICYLLLIRAILKYFQSIKYILNNQLCYVAQNEMHVTYSTSDAIFIFELSNSPGMRTE
jgi:hypothetical protein